MHLFSHGGVLFLMISSTALAVMYAVTLALPILPCGRWVTVPNKKSFYHYILLLLLLNIVEVSYLEMSFIITAVYFNYLSYGSSVWEYITLLF